MSKDIYIITGASRGIGAALFDQLTDMPAAQVLGVARSNPAHHENFICADLTDLSAYDAIVAWLQDRRSNASSVTLINNAGMVEPIGRVGALDAAALAQSVALNVTAPMALTNAVLGMLADIAIPKKILNISSGASQSSIAGWASYCAAKAALDHFTRVLHLEQQDAAHPARVMAVAPGVIDTGMQETIRAAEASAFPDVERFRELKQRGQLQSPEETARGLIALLQSPSFGAQAVGRL